MCHDKIGLCVQNLDIILGSIIIIIGKVYTTPFQEKKKKKKKKKKTLWTLILLHLNIDSKIGNDNLSDSQLLTIPNLIQSNGKNCFMELGMPTVVPHVP
jgi:hypothetical protein